MRKAAKYSGLIRLTDPISDPLESKSALPAQQWIDNNTRRSLSVETRRLGDQHTPLGAVAVKGKEQPKVDRPGAGMLFYNNEGSENGGLVFGGHRNEKDEVVASGASLSFDKYGAAGQNRPARWRG